MTTPDSAAVRSWARDQGLVVADRGRLPTDVVSAYAAAHPQGSGAPGDRPAAARKPRRTASRRPAAQPTAEPAGRPAPAPNEERGPGPAAPAADEDGRGLAALSQQVAALSQRVASLEAAAAARPARNRFRLGR